MGTFFVEVVLAHPQRPTSGEPFKLLVETGSTYTWVPDAFLKERLGVAPTTSRRVLTIEGKSFDRPAAWVLVTLEGEAVYTLCLFAEPGELAVLGALTLEERGLVVDPTRRHLVPATLYGA